MEMHFAKDELTNTVVDCHKWNISGTEMECGCRLWSCGLA